VLITVGFLFVLQNFTSYDFGQTWPVLLIVIGLMSLLARSAPPDQPPVPPPQYGWQPPAWQPQSWPPQAPPANPTAPGGYRATAYAESPSPQPPAAAAPKPDEPTETSTLGGAV